MKEQLVLAVEARKVTGKQVKRLRGMGMTPAVVYGHNLESVSVQVKSEDLAQVLRKGGRTSIVQLKMGKSKPFAVAIKQLHTHPISGQLLHADFYRVAEGEKLKMRVPLLFEGEAPVLKEHQATLVRTMNDIQVECLPGDLPPAVPVNLTVLDTVGASIRVGDLSPMDRVTYLDLPEEVIVSVAAAAREPEVVEKAAETAEAVAPGEGEAVEPSGHAEGAEDAGRAA